MITTGNLATVFENQGRYSESEKLQREVLARCRRTPGPDHPLTAVALYNIADVLYYEHRYSEAATFLRETVEIQRRVLGIDNPDTVDSISKLARVLALTRKRDEAISLLADAVDHGLSAETFADLEKDAALKSLYGDPRFDTLRAKMQKRPIAAAQKTN